MVCERHSREIDSGGRSFAPRPALAYAPAEWVACTAPPPLLARQVHIWAVDLDAAADVLTALCATLSERERSKAQRFRFPVHRDRYIASRGFLRHLLGQYLGVAPAQLEFRYGFDRVVGSGRFKLK